MVKSRNNRNNFLSRKSKIVNYGKLGATKKAFIGPKKPWVNIAALPSNAAAENTPVANTPMLNTPAPSIPVSNTKKIKAFSLPQFGSHDGGKRKKTHRKRR